MARPRLHLRPPGLKPWTKIGALGPFRGRLGLQWVVAPVVLGAILVVVGWLYLSRSVAPQPPFVQVATVQQIGDGAPRTFTLGGQQVLIGFDARGVPFARRATGCTRFDTMTYRGAVYVDPADPLPCRMPTP
jgi:hypothetical protein